MQNPSLSPALLEAYQGTSFMAIVNGQVLSVRLDKRCADLERVIREHGAQSGVFITAYNPRSELQSDSKNQTANLELERILRQRSLHFFAHVGRNGPWSEQGFFVLDLEPDAALALTENFGQFAVVILRPGDVAKLRLTSLVMG
jgi:hypothetical protein